MDLSLLPKIDKIMIFLKPRLTNHPLLTSSAKEAVERLRCSLTAGENPSLGREELFSLACRFTEELYAKKQLYSLRPVINATGITLHTNLGRAPVAEEALDNIAAIARGYSNLELNLDSGKRGSRYSHVVELLRELTGAESALVVNNNAAGVMLVLDTLAKGGEAIVSRGQLVEIGGSFRIPDIMEKSGARLVEVGSTNKTRLSDYANAITGQTSMIMQVHPSNFRITGFHQSVPTAELAKLAAANGIPVMDDLGSGCVYPLAARGIGDEPLIAQVIAAGADIVTCSGDKLLGGPQAGIILGNKLYIDQIKQNPLTRALRVDKFTMAALESTLQIYRRGEEQQLIPVIRMLTMPLEQLKSQAEQLLRLLQAQPGAEQLYQAAIVPGVSESGGGSLPGVELPTFLLRLQPLQVKVQELTNRLREGAEPLIGYIHEDMLCLDPRTMSDDDLAAAAKAIASCCQDATGSRK